jgi:hypothetical protein
MAGEHHAQLAVVALAAYIRNGIAAYLRAVEMEQSLTTSSLTDPLAVVEARVPRDNRSPRYEVYCETGEPHPEAGERRKVHAWDLTVAYFYAGDADVEEGERFLMRQYTALRRLIEADYSLGGTVIVSRPGRVEFEVTRGDNAQTNHEFAWGFEVHIHDA